MINDIFERWRIDIIGPLLLTPRKNKYIVVAVEHFINWPEVSPLKTADANSVAEFIYEEIIYRHRLPKIIQSDQDTYFVNKVIKQLIERFRIKHSLSLPYYSQTNGLVKRFNQT